MAVIDAELLAILACPEDRGPLELVEAVPGEAGTAPAGLGREFLYNRRLRRGYRIDDGIPVLLVDEAVHLDDAAAARVESLIRPS